jgi:hypothetical protein
VAGVKPTPRPVDTMGPVTAAPPAPSRDLESAPTGTI